MKYLLVNPFNPAHGNGVNSYYQSLSSTLGRDLDLVEFSNNGDEDISTFQKSVLSFVQANFGKDEVLIEAPETRAATLLLDRGYRTHVRLHTPLATCHKYEGKEINQLRFSEELRVIAQAAAVSAPSYGIVREIAGHLDTSNFIVNKNPILKSMPYLPKRKRRYDVIFMGRFNAMKGVEYLDAFLELLPRGYKVALVGTGATKFRLRNAGKVSFVAEHIEGDQRFDVLANSRVCIVPSLFENCSMMILEAIAAGVPVVAWQRGGNDEFPTDLVTTVEFDQINSFVSAIVDGVENADISQERAAGIVTEINADFVAGTHNVVDRLSDNSSTVYRSGFVAPPRAAPQAKRLSYSFEPESFLTGKRIMGFTVSNEHIEEMWAPVLNFLGCDYRFVCRRPLGFHSKFGERYPVREGSFIQHDWVKNPAKLMDLIAAYKPDVLLTHNGSHPMYQQVMQRLKAFNLPVVFTELGWFPQDGNIYFDRWGVNGGSSIAASSFSSLVGRASAGSSAEAVQSPDVLVATQLNNDTNIKVFSPRFRSADSFVEHVVGQLRGSRKILIKPHPLDPDAARFDALRGEGVEIVSTETPVSELLPQVGHVFAINSTVLLEALDYDVNIYSGGLGLLDNKGVAISLVDQDAKAAISDHLVGSKEDRSAIVRALKQRQVNIASLAGRSLIDEGQIDRAFNPLVEAFLLSRPRWPAVTAAVPAAAKAPASPQQPVGLTHTQLYKRAREHYHAKRYPMAAVDFMKAASMPGSGANILRCAAEAYVHMGDIPKALSALEGSAKLQKNKRLNQRVAYLKRPRFLQRITDAAVFEVPTP